MKKLYIGDNQEIKVNSNVKEVAIKITTDEGDKDIFILKDFRGKLWLNLSQPGKGTECIPLAEESISLDNRGNKAITPRAFNIEIIDGSIRLTNNGVIEAEVSALTQLRPDSAVKWGVPEVLKSLENLRNAKEQGPFWRAQEQLKDALHVLGKSGKDADTIGDLINEVFPGPKQEEVDKALEQIKGHTKRIETEIKNDFKDFYTPPKGLSQPRSRENRFN